MRKIPYTLPNSNLFHAALMGRREQAKEAIAEGANVNYQEIDRTVMQVAVASNNLELVGYLLRQKVGGKSG